MRSPDPAQKAALAVTRAVGSPASIIVHTILFVGCFLFAAFGYIAFDLMLLVLTTIVSLEAIYLAIFIQMTINYQGAQIAAVTEDIDEIQEDVGEIQEDVEEMTEDVEEIQKDVDEIQKDVDEIQGDVDELQEDVTEMSEDVGELEESDSEDEKRKAEQRVILANIEATLRKLAEDVERMKTR